MNSRSVLLALSALLVLCGSAAPAVAQAGSLPFEVGAAVWTPEAPRLDGRLNEDVWQRAIPLEPFQSLIHQVVAVQTTAYLLYDRERLYIGVRCLEPQPDRIKATVDTRDGAVYTDDCIEIFLVPPDSPLLSPYEEQLRYFHLVVNTLGARYDEIGYMVPAAFDGTWTAAAARTPEGWSLEVSVPFADLEVSGADGAVWRGNVCRSRTGQREYSTWAPLERSFHDLAHFGQIVFTRDAGATAARIEELEFAALKRGLLDPRLDSLKVATAQLREDGQKLPAPVSARMEQSAAALAARLEVLASELGALTPANFRGAWQGLAERLAAAGRDIQATGDEIAMLATTDGGRLPCVVFVTPALSNERLPSTRFPRGLEPGGQLEITACPGEYESATFSVYAARDLRQLSLRIPDLRAGDSKLPARCIDPYLVKCWYQAGRGIADLGQRLLVPELLLKDGDLVRVDHASQRNFVRQRAGGDRYLDVSDSVSTALAELAPRDADRLLPVDVPARSLQQFWLTAHIPDDAAPGVYQGAVTLRARGEDPVELPLRLRVLPFVLEEPALEYSIYYRGRLTEGGEGTLSSEGKSTVQFAAEMRDLVAHGVTNPTIYQRYDEQLLPQVFALREAAGMRGERVYTLGVETGAPQTAEALAELKRSVHRWRALVEGRGYRALYVYGIDEAHGEAFAAERAAFAAVHEAGARVFVACYRDWFELVGDRLDLPVWSGQPDPAQARLAHRAGARIFNYGHPQCGVEEPETYRRNFGLLLWRDGYDGAMDYAYQHSFGHGWNDFDSPRYRDHNMTYPTVDGVIGTVQWEGFREGVDDVRYLTTLLRRAEEAMAAGGQRAARARAALAWAYGIDALDDLDGLRAQAIEHILALQGGESGP